MAKDTKTHAITTDDARWILKNVQFISDDANRVEIPLSALKAKFDVGFPLNLLAADGEPSWVGRTIVNGFSRTTEPATVDFYLSKLAGVAGITDVEARAIVSSNGVSFEKHTIQSNYLLNTAVPAVDSILRT